MKARLFTLLLSWLSIGLLATVPALAGEYHFGESLECAQCHTMHYSQQHDYSGNDTVGTGSSPPHATMGGSGPYTNLLRHEANDLCLSCHDGQTFAPDVLGTNTNDSYVRQAGGLTRKGISVGAGYAETNGHTVGWTLVPGNHGIPGIGGWGDFPCNNCHNGGWPPPITKRFPGRKLACVSCHDPHGAASYRNLAFFDDTVRLITYAIDTGSGISDTTKDVFLRGWTGGNIGGTTSNYRLENVDFNEPSGNPPGMSGFCSKCHGFFHGTASDNHMRDQTGPSGINWLRHPTGDADIGDYSSDEKHSSLTVFGGNRNRLKVMSPGGVWGPQSDPWEGPPGPPDNLTPTCITCHKAHGNKSPFGLIYMAGSGTVSEEGTIGGEYTDLCHQCHTQGL
ncbi:hypothetical protein ACFL6S_06345 [Candidatus Poribacteria bacterium]